MKTHFENEHREAFGKSPSKGGYPDTGNGRYSEKLAY